MDEDSKFLCNHNIMDYSLLLTVEKVPRNQGSMKTNKSQQFTRNTYISNDCTEAYHFGVIDYLQRWNGSKKREKFFKVNVLNKKWQNLSAVEPKFYQSRWVDFVQSCLESKENKSEMITTSFNELQSYYDGSFNVSKTVRHLFHMPSGGYGAFGS